MIKEAIEYLLKLKRPETIQLNGKDYSTIEINPIKEEKCDAITVFNLDSIIKYLKDDPDNYKEKVKIINIVSPVEVIVESTLFGNFK